MTKHLMLALALVTTLPALAAPPEQRPYSCKLLDDEQRNCAFGSWRRPHPRPAVQEMPARRRPAMSEARSRIL
jgi:hypothetical protein